MPCWRPVAKKMTIRCWGRKWSTRSKRELSRRRNSTGPSVSERRDLGWGRSERRRSVNVTRAVHVSNPNGELTPMSPGEETSWTDARLIRKCAAAWLHCLQSYTGAHERRHWSHNNTTATGSKSSSSSLQADRKQLSGAYRHPLYKQRHVGWAIPHFSDTFSFSFIDTDIDTDADHLLLVIF